MQWNVNDRLASPITLPGPHSCTCPVPFNYVANMPEHGTGHVGMF